MAAGWGRWSRRLRTEKMQRAAPQSQSLTRPSRPPERTRRPASAPQPAMHVTAPACPRSTVGATLRARAQRERSGRGSAGCCWGNEAIAGDRFVLGT